MALSRAAAAAARKAAKSRGLQGNRADDGSMLTDTSRYVPHEKYNEIVRSTHDRIDAKTAAAMSDDELVAAPDGRHELAEGRKIDTEGGVIVSVEEVEEVAEEEEVEEEMENDKPFTEAQEREAKKIIESIVTERVFGMEATLEEENKELKKEISNLKEAFNCLVDLTEKLIEKPTTDTVKKNKSGFAKLKPKKTDLIARLKSKYIIN